MRKIRVNFVDMTIRSAAIRLSFYRSIQQIPVLDNERVGESHTAAKVPKHSNSNLVTCSLVCDHPTIGSNRRPSTDTVRLTSRNNSYPFLFRLT